MVSYFVSFNLFDTQLMTFLFKRSLNVMSIYDLLYYHFSSKFQDSCTFKVVSSILTVNIYIYYQRWPNPFNIIKHIVQVLATLVMIKDYCNGSHLNLISFIYLLSKGTHHFSIKLMCMIKIKSNMHILLGQKWGAVQITQWLCSFCKPSIEKSKDQFPFRWM